MRISTNHVGSTVLGQNSVVTELSYVSHECPDWKVGRERWLLHMLIVGEWSVSSFVLHELHVVN